MTLMACVQIPNFAIAVARRDAVAPPDAPLILYTTRPRATVYAAYPEAPAGLPLRQAVLRIPHAVCWPATPKRDHTMFARLTSLLQTFSPRVEAGNPLPDATTGTRIDLDRLTFDDKAVFELIARADTVGVFQVESWAQAQILPILRPTCFANLIIGISLIRPGPLQGDMVQPYLRRRRRLEPVTYKHPLLGGCWRRR